MKKRHGLWGSRGPWGAIVLRPFLSVTARGYC